MLPDRSQTQQRADLTFRGNVHSGRHGWLRLTTAYSLTLARERMAHLAPGSSVLEPFAGSGTTPLVAEEMGLHCQAREINPFLVWFTNAKLDYYSPQTRSEAQQAAAQVLSQASACEKADIPFWTPPIHHIERWWDPVTLKALAALKSFINIHSGQVRNLLDVAFCRVMMGTSNVVFNHQSMSLKKLEADTDQPAFELPANTYQDVLTRFQLEFGEVVTTLAEPLRLTASVHQGDSKTPFDAFEPADMVLTSPPYCNRMSYIRELRPYMYWLGFLTSGEQASDLDWKSTGGTWGKASTRLRGWSPSISPDYQSDDSQDGTPVPTPAELEASLPIASELAAALENIEKGKSGDILAPYVHKYFLDMWQHFLMIDPVLKPGGDMCYVIGNSTFSGTEVPTHRWYAQMMEALGYTNIHIDTLRKRNSNKALYEFAVCAHKPSAA